MVRVDDCRVWFPNLEGGPDVYSRPEKRPGRNAGFGLKFVFVRR